MHQWCWQFDQNPFGVFDESIDSSAQFREQSEVHTEISDIGSFPSQRRIRKSTLRHTDLQGVVQDIIRGLIIQLIVIVSHSIVS